MNYKDKDWLYYQYIELNKYAKDIAKEQNISTVSIYKWLEKYEIKKYDNKIYRNKEWLFNQYINNEKSAHQITKEENCSYSIIYYWLNNFNILIRNRSEARKKIKFTKEHKQNLSKARRGEKNPNWKGGKRKHYKGYIRKYVYDHPYSGKRNAIMEHRLIMEKYIGRYLNPKERIHHINGIKYDNRIENLYLCSSRSTHMKLHTQIESLVMELYEKRIIKFNKEKGVYYYVNLH